jgi:hypothetical protein
MSKTNFLIISLQVLGRFLGGIFFFPIWWYSLGFLRFVSKIIAFWQGEQRRLGFWLWLKNLFVPMYGQHDLAGRLISFFVRLVQIIFRGLILLLWFIICLLLLVIWLVLPFGLMLALAFQIIAI